MAVIHLSIFMPHLLFSSLLLFFSCYSFKACVYGAGDVNNHDHVVDISSLLPKPTCSPSPRDSEGHSRGLKISNRYGPCSPLGHKRTSLTSHQILLNDQSRVRSINARTFNQYPTDESKAILPNSDVDSVGDGNFVVTVGFGTPKRNFTLIFDTGSDITWIQCEPCSVSCYTQREAIFDPSTSSSYSKGPCVSSSTSKTYNMEYHDGSHSNGFFGCDTLALPPSDVFPEFQFGCGQNNSEGFGEAAGLLGLGQGELSLVSQTDKKFGKTFSYCLPPTGSSTGHLLFGDEAFASSSSLKFTPLIKNSESELYFLKLIGISVSKKRLNVSPSVFSSPGTIIDSGTVITRLPPSAYSALRAAFRRSMAKYPFASRPFPPLLDTCYDLTRYKNVTIPNVVLHFEGGADVSLDPSGILWAPENKFRMCLAFAGNNDTRELAIIGSIQQQAIEVVYDIKGGRIGFGVNGCKN